MSAVGIDLGTTNCCVAYVKDGKDIRIIPDKSTGDRVLPSCILFTEKNYIIGKIAQNRSAGESNKIHDIKRLMGTKISDVDLDLHHYTIISERNRLKVRVKTASREFFLTPEEISALLLKRIKESARDYLDNLEKAVITVPAYFNERQRRATIDAGKIAGFKEIQLLNEPTAAAIAYAFEYTFNEPKTILIFDFGGGTFDVSIVKILDRTLEVLGMGGDLYLGGNDVDENLLRHVLGELRSKYQLDVTDHRKLERLRHLCKRAKEDLSGDNKSQLELEMFSDDTLEIEIDIIQFDKLNEGIYRRIIDKLEVCLKSAQLRKDDVDEVVMVGGSTKIKRINSMLKDYFGKDLRYNINPDEAVAMGAAIQASIWSNPQESEYRDIKFNDISTYTLGVETQGEQMAVVIPKHTPLPATKSKRFQTTADRQESVLVRVFSGESNMSRDNHFLGDLRVTGFPLGPAGSVILKETFHLNKDGMLEITVIEERSQGNVRRLKISLDESGSLKEEEIKECKLNIENLYAQNEVAQLSSSIKMLNV